MSEETKVCSGPCKRTLAFSAFNKNATRPDGLQRFCRECQAAQKATWAEENREKTREYDRERGHIRNRFMELEHSAIVPSLTNPRKHFDQAFLEELAASIRDQGIAQPILVRPLPGSRLQETYTDRRADAPRPTHEIIAGEQRWRACAMAGLRKLPALVRPMSDAEVLQLQLVENLKRRDLHPMEEAEGYDKLRETTGLTAEGIAERIGKGRSYVYKTMQLLQLLPEARQAFYEGKLTRSTAELVAARPHTIQLQVLKDITATDFHGEPMSFRKAKAHVDDRYMLKLGAAPFKITDETLMPEAGSCRTCPKRSGANPELFDDVPHADTCTDPECFSSKKEAHYARVRAEAEARGQSVITGREAKEIMPDSNTLRGYTRVDDTQALGGQMKTLRKVLGKDMPATTLIEDPRTHEMVEALPTATASKLLKDHGITKSAPQEAAQLDEATAKRQGAEKLEKTWRQRAIEKVHEAASAPASGFGISGPVVRLLALLVLDGLMAEQQRHVASILELGKVAARDALESHIKTVDEGQAEAVLFLLLAEHDMRQLLDQSDKPAPAPHIEALAADLSIDLEALRAAAKKEIRDAITSQRVDEAAKAVKAAAKPAAGKPARPPKVSKEEAAATIAAQLQTVENPNKFEPGQRVRLKTDLRKGENVFNTRGVEADVLHAIGDRAWLVQPESPSFPLSADYTEMEAV
ncbi:ParB/RepB/Spo0J family partition protein [Variovorax boronicumulans]|uniref:ParB/RepB/Spo0J family partition protein n=1 Tax=Variovorax boronicumulans TaxID=436515 RepID=UPI0036F3CA38